MADTSKLDALLAKHGALPDHAPDTSKLDALLAKHGALPQESSGNLATDIPKAVVRGVAQLPEAVAGVGQTAATGYAKLADLAAGNQNQEYETKVASTLGGLRDASTRKLSKAVQEALPYSSGTQAAQTQLNKDIEAIGQNPETSPLQKGLQAAKAAIANPRAALPSIAESVPQYIAGAKGLQALKVGGGMLAKGVGMNALLEGSGGEQGAREDIQNTPLSTLQKSPNFQKLEAQYGPEEARRIASEMAGSSAYGPAAALGGAASLVTGGGGETRMLSKLLGEGTQEALQPGVKNAVKYGAKEIAKSAAREIPEETLQGAGGQFAQNVGEQPFTGADLSKGVAEQSGMGAVQGAIGGGVFGTGGTLASLGNKQAEDKEEVLSKKTQDLIDAQKNLQVEQLNQTLDNAPVKGVAGRAAKAAVGAGVTSMQQNADEETQPAAQPGDYVAAEEQLGQPILRKNGMPFKNEATANYFIGTRPEFSPETHEVSEVPGGFAITRKQTGEPNAVSIEEATQSNGGGSPQPTVREESGDTAESRKGVRGGGQEPGPVPEAVDFAKNVVSGIDKSLSEPGSAGLQFITQPLRKAATDLGVYDKSLKPGELLNAVKSKLTSLETPIDDAISKEHPLSSDNDYQPAERPEDSKKAVVNFQELPIAIENPEGSERTGTSANGTEWRTKMRDHYGEILTGNGADGDAVDVFIPAGLTRQQIDNTDKAYIVDQIDPKTGLFDEHKVVLGVPDIKAAEQVYRQNYDPDWKGLGAIHEMPMDEFKSWVKDEYATKKPLSADILTGRENELPGTETAEQKLTESFIPFYTGENIPPLANTAVSEKAPRNTEDIPEQAAQASGIQTGTAQEVEAPARNSVNPRKTLASYVPDGDLSKLFGKTYAPIRQQLLQELTGTKVEQRNATNAALRDAFYKAAGIDPKNETSQAAADAKLRDWIRQPVRGEDRSEPIKKEQVQLDTGENKPLVHERYQEVYKNKDGDSIRYETEKYPDGYIISRAFKGENQIGFIDTRTEKNGSLFPAIDVFVEPTERRKGVASNLYRIVETHGGLIAPLSKGDDETTRSAEAQAFRESRELANFSIPSEEQVSPYTFKQLHSTNKSKVAAVKQQLENHPQKDAVIYLSNMDNFLDIISNLEDNGKVTIKC